MFPVVVGLNYRTAPVEIREKLNIHHSQIVSSLKELSIYPEMKGVVLLSTCNRMEVYAVTTDVELGTRFLQDYFVRKFQDESHSIHRYLYTHTLYPAVSHLFRVVSGLDSMVLGESQILGQVAKAYELSSKAGVNNKIIHVMFQKALAVGKRVRTETCIDRYSTSISYTAVELAGQYIPSFKDKKILVLGAGEMSGLTMKHLVARGAATLMISNRSLEKAREFAAGCGGEAVSLLELESCLEEADLVFSATASKGFIITADSLRKAMRKRPHRPMLLIDIAVPRDIDPGVRDIEGVTLYDIDDLRSVVDHHQSARESAAQDAEIIIEEEMALFKKWHNSLFVLPTILALQQRGEEIKNAQLDQAMAKLGEISPKQEKVIRSLASSIINKFLHVPITTLKKVSDTPQGHLYTEILQNSFRLDVNEDLISVDIRENSNGAPPVNLIWRKQNEDDSNWYQRE
ncbi:MAG: glutamyl-tRNA reductase [Peptococcaceae bacterium]|nr:glutamyl-tRNA reductase [Peptococcaceae bacterium]